MTPSLLVLGIANAVPIAGVLVLALFGPKGTQPFDLLGTVPPAIRANHLGWAVVTLVASHGIPSAPR